MPPHSSPVPETHAGAKPGAALSVRELPLRHPTLAGALVLAILVAAFLYKPLAYIQTHHYLAADVTQNQSLTNQVPGHRSGNQLISDPVVEMVPWLLFNREELGAGRLPVWNPYNACGVPHLANYQSSVFSPFSLPFYLMRLKFALLLTAGCKLYLLGLFTYLFLLRQGVAHLPALVGAAAFQFGANNVLLLSYPHSGVMVTLPATMYFAEVAFARLEATLTGARARLLWPVVGVGLALALGLSAGHPEPYYFCVWMLAVHVVFRLSHYGWHEPRLRWKPLVRLGAGMLVAALLAALSGAWQVLPFFEYLERSEMLTLRSHRQTPLEGGLWVMHLFPDFMGTPTSPHYTRWTFPPPNYEAANSVYIGGLVLLMGALSWLLLLRDRRYFFFGLVALVWPIYAYDLFGALTLFSQFPSLDIAPVNRSQGLWHFALGVCSALLLDAAMRIRGRVRLAWAAATLLLGGAGLGLTYWRASDWLPKAATSLDFKPELVEYIRRGQDALALSAAIGILALTGLWIARRTLVQRALVAVILIVVFFQCGFYLRDYNPVSRDELVYPHTNRTDALRHETAGKRLAIFGEDNLPPHTNLRYDLEILASYDALGIHLFEQLHSDMFQAKGNWRIASLATERGLAMFGVGWTLTYQDVTTGSAKRMRELFRDGPAVTSAEILPESPLEQGFTALDPGLCSIAVRLDDSGRSNSCHLRLELFDQASGAAIAARTISCGESSFSPEQRQRLVLAFPPLADSAGRAFKLVVSSDDATPGNALRAWISLLAGHPELAHLGPLTRGGAPLEGTLMLEHCDDDDPFQPVARLGPHTLYRFGGSAGKAFAVGDTQLASDLPEAWKRVREPAMDPRKTVVLGPEAQGPAWERAAPAGGEPSSVQILEERPGYWRIAAPREAPGHLVLTQSYFPGWRAFVDGRERPVVQANYAFTAVPLEPGPNVVELVYEPDSVRLGLMLTGTAVALALLAVGYFARTGARAA